MTLQRCDVAGKEYDLGQIVGGTVPIKDQVIEVTAPNVTIIGLEGRDMQRSSSDPQGDNDWSAFIRVRSGAENCIVAESTLDDVDVLGIHCAAPGLRVYNTEITNIAGGIMLDGAQAYGSLIEGSAIHQANRMLRDTPTGGDDTGAQCLMYKRTPMVTDPQKRNRVIGSYVGDAIAHSTDYGWGEGSGIEFYEACSLFVQGCVLLDCAATFESGSKAVQMRDVHMWDNWIGALEVTNDELYRRGLGFRPTSDSSLLRNRTFALDHWDFVFNWPTSNYGYGMTSNFRVDDNRHACTRNSKAYSLNNTSTKGSPSIGPGELVLYGSAAASLAVQFRTEAIALRDDIVAVAGIRTSPEPTIDELKARIVELEGMVSVRDAHITELDGSINDLNRWLQQSEATVAQNTVVIADLTARIEAAILALTPSA